MIRTEIKLLQRHLNQSGYGPLVEDGVYGPATQAAHEWQLQTKIHDGPVVTPPAAKPWWASRAMWGALTTIGLAIAGLFIDTSSLDAKELTDALVRISTGIAGLLALYGTVTRTAPIDPTLAAPGVRWGTHRARADGGERMQPEPVPTRGDAPDRRNSAGFPDGPFFDS